jgi:hypothetical protein
MLGVSGTREQEEIIMAEAKTYTGGCHCGHVRYQARADLERTVACNCSICTQRGLVLTFIPPAQFTLESGENDLVDYRFNKNIIQHLFCPNCGVEAFARGKMPDGSEMIALNVRSIDGIEMGTLRPEPYDGRHL